MTAVDMIHFKLAHNGEIRRYGSQLFFVFRPFVLTVYSLSARLHHSKLFFLGQKSEKWSDTTSSTLAFPSRFILPHLPHLERRMFERLHVKVRSIVGSKDFKLMWKSKLLSFCNCTHFVIKLALWKFLKAVDHIGKHSDGNRIPSLPFYSFQLVSRMVIFLWRQWAISPLLSIMQLLWLIVSHRRELFFLQNSVKSQGSKWNSLHCAISMTSDTEPSK